jgi:transketolase
MSALHERIIEISKKHGLSHNGSCLTSVSIIDEIYSIRKENEPFILSNGHAGLSLYTVIEKYYGIDAEALYLKHGTHPNRDMEDKIWCSTGSLGHGIGIALGMALADRSRNVYCLISDGEAYEGLIWETANAMHRYEVDNLKLYMNYNGFSAYNHVEPQFIERVRLIFGGKINIIKTDTSDYNLFGLSAHYVKL